jgi:exosome complex component RRP4
LLLINFFLAQPLSVEAVVPGDLLATAEAGLLRGHGTIERGARPAADNDEEADRQPSATVASSNLYASVAGLVSRVNKLVAVRALRARYTPDVGDVVVGRVTELANKRWKLDIGARQDAILLLSAIQLPGGALRRRTQSDELQMREFFVEDDLAVAEVQQFFSDGAVALHTRSSRYGRLGPGQLVCVPPALVRRGKTAFVQLAPLDLELVLAANGMLHLHPYDPVQAHVTPTSSSETDPDAPPLPPPPVTDTHRRQMARCTAAICALRAVFAYIGPASILQVYHDSERLQLAPPDMLLPANLLRLTASLRPAA